VGIVEVESIQNLLLGKINLNKISLNTPLYSDDEEEEVEDDNEGLVKNKTNNLMQKLMVKS
jgi:hypothetical protein